MSDIIHPHAHSHRHADASPHDHDLHGHSHHGHGHHGNEPGHGHYHDGPAIAARPAAPAFSLLTLSVWERLLGAAVLSMILWLAVWWALA